MFQPIFFDEEITKFYNPSGENLDALFHRPLKKLLELRNRFFIALPRNSDTELYGLWKVLTKSSATSMSPCWRHFRELRVTSADEADTSSGTLGKRRPLWNVHSGCRASKLAEFVAVLRLSTLAIGWFIVEQRIGFKFHHTHPEDLTERRSSFTATAETENARVVKDDKETTLPDGNIIAGSVRLKKPSE